METAENMQNQIIDKALNPKFERIGYKDQVLDIINSLDLNETLGVSEKDRLGRERDLSQELARAFTGITESDSQASQGLKYKGYEFAKARQDAANIFNSIARRPNVTSDQLKEAYKEVIMNAHCSMDTPEGQEMVTMVENHAIKLGIIEPYPDDEWDE